MSVYIVWRTASQSVKVADLCGQFIHVYTHLYGIILEELDKKLSKKKKKSILEIAFFSFFFFLTGIMVLYNENKKKKFFFFTSC